MKGSFLQTLQSLAIGFRVANAHLVYIVPFLFDAIIKNAYRRTSYRELPMPALTLTLFLSFFLIMIGYQFMLPSFIETQERNLRRIVRKSLDGLRRLLLFLLLLILFFLGLSLLSFSINAALFHHLKDYNSVLSYLRILDGITWAISIIISIISLLFIFTSIFFSIEKLRFFAAAKKSFWFSLRNLPFILTIGVIILIQYAVVWKVTQVSWSHPAAILVMKFISEYFHFWILMSCLTLYQLQMPRKTPSTLR